MRLHYRRKKEMCVPNDTKSGTHSRRRNDRADMDEKAWKGSITVFLSLLSILVFSLICTAVESARIQGAKTQTANIAGMSTYSLLGEFEKPLLDDYEIFALDGAYGSGKFQQETMKNRLDEYLTINTNPKEDVFSIWCFDPWNLTLTDSKVSSYTLLTDESGEPFYQQAVGFMKTNAAFLTLEKLGEYSENARTIQKWEEEYEKRKKENENLLEDLEKAKEEKLGQLESEADKTGTELEESTVKNPLTEIAKLRKKSVLEIVTGGKSISEQKLKTGKLPSKQTGKKGTLSVHREYSGAMANALFREYLVIHFPNYCSDQNQGKLKYQLEYILGGKNTDKKNLKYVVNRLLLIREGMNYLYCLENQEMNGSAEGLAVTLTGFLGIPALTAATKHALLLAWAYGESLIDVRELLAGGKIPLFKNATTWQLSLENLGRIGEILEQGSGSGTEGMTYTDYLRCLLAMGSLSQQKMRALDMIQCNLQEKEESKNFYAWNCITGVETQASWEGSPVFFRVPTAFLGIGGETVTWQQTAGMAYE